MPVRSLLIATMTLATPTLAAEQMAKSGSFITASSFKGIEQAQQTGGRTLSHGVVYGIVTEDNPLHIRTANCPYISEVSGDTVSLVGKCAWTDGEDDIFTDWNTTFWAVRDSLMAHKLSLEVRASSAAFKVVIPSSVRWWEKKVSSSAPKTGLIS